MTIASKRSLHWVPEKRNKMDCAVFRDCHNPGYSKNILTSIDWGVCAFGKAETDCLIKAFSLGGKLRVGFENNFYNKDGKIAETNADRVSEIVKLIDV